MLLDERGIGDLFFLLGMPLRLRVVKELVEAGELPFQELRRRLGEATSYALVNQMPKLRQAGVVASRRSGGQVLWSISDGSPAALVLQWFRAAGIERAKPHDEPDEFAPDAAGRHPAGGPLVPPAAGGG